MTIVEARELLTFAFTYQECPIFKRDELVHNATVKRSNRSFDDTLNTIDAKELGYQIFKHRMSI